MKKCPLCNMKLVYYDNEDFDAMHCPTKIILPNNMTPHHYFHDIKNQYEKIHTLPFKMINRYGTSQILKMVERQPVSKRYKTSSFYFKLILTCPTIHLDVEDKLLQRIKLLLALS